MSIPFLKSKPGAAREEDPLALFEAESTLSIDGESVATVADARVQAIQDEEDVDLSLGSVATSEPIALESVLARKMFLSWPEGVAIVEGTCAALVPANGSELGAPEPSDILLTAEGTIEVNGRGHRGESVQRLARTLHDVTSGQAIPAPFRLFISKWIAVDGRHTIAEFARELAYFARPNGRDLIREVYGRALAELIAQPLEPRRKQAAAEGPKPKAEKPKPKPANKRQQAVLVAAAVAFVITAAVAAAILGSTAPPPGQEGSSDIVSNLLARAADFARSLGDVKTQIGQLSSQLSAHLAAGDDAPAATPPASTATSPNRTRTGARSSQAAPRPASGLPAPPSSFLGAPDIPLPTLAPSATPLESANAASPAPGAVPATAPVIVDPNIVYTSADEGVNPPKMLYPQLPPPALVLGSASSLNVMEITIADTGLVERVKLVSHPRRLTDMMLLSGAKLWKFTPASKDGQPVKYRIAVSWAASIP
jgi:periplasmic protein TonB